MVTNVTSRRARLHDRHAQSWTRRPEARTQGLARGQSDVSPPCCPRAQALFSGTSSCRREHRDRLSPLGPARNFWGKKLLAPGHPCDRLSSGLFRGGSGSCWDKARTDSVPSPPVPPPARAPPADSADPWARQALPPGRKGAAAADPVCENLTTGLSLAVTQLL